MPPSKRAKSVIMQKPKREFILSWVLLHYNGITRSRWYSTCHCEKIWFFPGSGCIPECVGYIYIILPARRNPTTKPPPRVGHTPLTPGIGCRVPSNYIGPVFYIVCCKYLCHDCPRITEDDVIPRQGWTNKSAEHTIAYHHRFPCITLPIASHVLHFTL